MKAKKFAVRALIVLAVVVAVCMFFSGTIRTIATAKVKITSPRQGKLIQKVELSGKLTFPVSEKVYLTGAGDASVEITSVKVLPGYAVAKGDVLFEAAVADYEKTMTQLRGEYDAIEQQLQALLQKGIKLKRTDQAWAEAYTALIDCRSKATDTKLAADTLLRVEGLLRTQDGTAPDGASEALVQALREQAEADSALSAAQQYMTDADRYAVAEDTRTYIVEKKKLEDQLATAGESMLNLSVLNQKLKSVVAEQDGWGLLKAYRSGRDGWISLRYTEAAE